MSREALEMLEAAAAANGISRSAMVERSVRALLQKKREDVQHESRK